MVGGYLDFGLCLIVSGELRATAVRSSPASGRDLRRPGRRALGEAAHPRRAVRKFSGDAGWFEALERREADALIYDYPFAAEEIKAHPRTKIVQFNLNQSRYAVGVPAGNDDLVDAVNAGHRRIRAPPGTRS